MEHIKTAIPVSIPIGLSLLFGLPNGTVGPYGPDMFQSPSGFLSSSDQRDVLSQAQTKKKFQSPSGFLSSSDDADFMGVR